MDQPDAWNTKADKSLLIDERFLLLLDTLPYPAFVIPTGGSAVHYNNAFIAYAGFRPGPSRADRTALHHPDDQAELIAAREASVATDSEYVVEIRLRRYDGAYRWHRIHNKPVFRDGRRVGYLGTAVDTHDARTATAVLEEGVRRRTAELEAANSRLAAEEMRYRDLYNQTPMALQSSSGDARLLDVNDTWLRMFGYERAQVLGRSPTEFMTSESAQTYRNLAWPDMLVSNGNVRIVDYQFVTASGIVFDGRLAARGVFDENGHLVRTWAAISDITAERMAERTLHQAQRLDAIGQLAAGIAHDFNNLLTVVLGNLSMALRPRLDEGRRTQLIADARIAAERGAKLIAQMLAFSRQQHLVPEHVDVKQTLNEMSPLLTSTIGSAIEVAVAVPPELPRAFADKTQLELAVLNLCINARDALGHGGRITITASAATVGSPMRAEEPEAGEYVVIEVQDNGPGIPDAVRERIFEPFFTTKNVGAGSGLGLAQVVGMVASALVV
jgi:PAS domain S-box-containing protein